MQDEFIHQIIFDEGMNEHAAAIEQNIFAGLVLEFAHFFDYCSVMKVSICCSQKQEAWLESD